MTHHGNITRHSQTDEDRRVVIVVVLYSRSSIVHDHYRDVTSRTFLFYLSPRPAIHANRSWSSALSM